MKVTLVSIAILLTLSASVDGAVVQYTNKAAWQSAVGTHTTIDFTGHSFGAPVLPHHYADLGVTFTGQQLGYFHSSGLFNDGEGIRSNNDTLWATFDEPQRAIAVDYPGQIRFQLYSNGQLIFTSILFSPGMGQTQAFAGLISDQSFDAVHLYRVNSTYVYIDDLHFGIPTPGALSVFALTAFGCRRRRRS